MECILIKRIWQKAMIFLALSPKIKEFIQKTKSGSTLAKKYVSGESPEEGIKRSLELKERQILSSLFYMGEYVDNEELVQINVHNKLLIAEKLNDANLDIHISVDPTQVGYQLSPAMCEEAVNKIAERISNLAKSKSRVNCLMLDMEDFTVNQATIELHNRLQDKGFKCALTLQAYLKKTYQDMSQQIQRGSIVRLVKGAFAAEASVAFTDNKEIKANYRKLIDLMLSEESKNTGFYPIIATHDINLHEYAISVARKNGWQQGTYEFEMLLGVRESAAIELARRGERIRLYVPFGKDWFPHAIRRIGENPNNAVLLLRSLFN